MARLSAAARVCLANTPDLPEAVRQLDLLLSGCEDRFVTYMVAVLDLDRFLATIVNAVHLPPMLRRAGQATVEELNRELAGLPLGVMGQPYEQTRVALQPGDTLVHAITLMGKKQIWDLPVVNERGILVGLLHLHPAVQALLGIKE